LNWVCVVTCGCAFSGKKQNNCNSSMLHLHHTWVQKDALHLLRCTPQIKMEAL